MDVLVWWVLPIATTIVAVCWAGWVRRPPRRLRDAETVESYARFRAALARSVDGASGNSRPGSDV